MSSPELKENRKEASPATPERVAMDSEVMRLDNERRLGELYGKFGIDLNASADLRERIKDFKINIIGSVNVTRRQEFIGQLAELKAEDPQAFVKAEGLIDLMEVDPALASIVELREKESFLERQRLMRQDQLSGAEREYKRMTQFLEEDRKEIARRIAEVAVSPFPEIDFDVNKAAVEALRRQEAGENPTMIVAYNAADEVQAKAYLDRRRADPRFEAAAVSYEGLESARSSERRDKTRVNNLRDEKEVAIRLLEEADAEVTTATQALGRFIRAAELQRSKLDTELKSSKSAGALEGRKIEIALSDTNDMGVPHVYEIAGVIGQNVTLLRTDTGRSDKNDSGRLFKISKTITLDELTKRGRLVRKA